MAMRLGARSWLIAAGLCGAGGVALAAVAAHAGVADPSLLELAAEFMLLHASAFALCAWLADRRGGALPQLAGLAFLAGIVLFSGTLGLRGWGVGVPGGVAPAGGVALIAGWLLLAGSALPRRF
jgi:uncharacterized membrane protein YgdD (TMEM256/DUF423 family)